LSSTCLMVAMRRYPEIEACPNLPTERAERLYFDC
jgi:hypothetical protein